MVFLYSRKKVNLEESLGNPGPKVQYNFEDAARCAQIQAKFYNDSFNEFHGESGSSHLKKHINEILKTFDEITVVDVGSNVGQLFKFLNHNKST